MGRLDIDQMTIARVLNHASTTKATVTGSTYDRHTYEPQMRRALEALDTEVRRILAGEGSVGNVVSVRQEPSLVVVAPAFSFDRHVRPSLAEEEANAND
jgi:hypothetical protein